MSSYSMSHKQDDMQELQNAILIVQSALSPITKKEIEALNPYIIEVFSLEQLLVNITHHELVPKHMVLSDDDKQELLKR